jgi:hypothetical protein
MNRAIFLISLVILFGPSCLAGSSPSTTSAGYGSRVNFDKDKIINFPDLALTFKGTRRADVKTPEGRPIPFGPYYDFDITTKASASAVSWSSGTGAIGPSNFRTEGKCFSLELKYADNIGKLDDDELVLKIAPDDWCRNAR